MFVPRHRRAKRQGVGQTKIGAGTINKRAVHHSFRKGGKLASRTQKGQPILKYIALYIESIPTVHSGINLPLVALSTCKVISWLGGPRLFCGTPDQLGFNEHKSILSVEILGKYWPCWFSFLHN